MSKWRVAVTLFFFRTLIFAKFYFYTCCFSFRSRDPSNSAFLRFFALAFVSLRRESIESRIFRCYGMGKEEEQCSIHQNCMSVAISTLPPARSTECSVYLKPASVHFCAQRYSMRTLSTCLSSCLTFPTLLVFFSKLFSSVLFFTMTVTFHQ